MKLLHLFACLLLTLGAIAQSDTLAPYQLNSNIPNFTLQLPDSSWFVKSQLSPKKSTLILYFSPDCGHCQLETEELLSKEKSLQKLQVVMVTSKPYDELKAFDAFYKLSRFKNIVVGRDPNRLITSFYKVKFTPFSALYNKKGKLVKVYEKGIDWEDLIKLLN